MLPYQAHSSHSLRRRRPPKRNPLKTILPLVLAVVFILSIVFLSNTLFRKKPEETPLLKNHIASFTLEEGKVEVLFEGGESSHVVEAGNLVKLNSKEGLRTTQDRVVVKVVNNDIIRVDKDTDVALEEHKGSSLMVTLKKGALWVITDTEKTLYPQLALRLPYANVLSSRGSVFAAYTKGGEDFVSVQKGSLQVEVLGIKDEVLRTITLGIGQEFSLTEAKRSALSSDPTVELVSAQSDTFKSSDWYTWNQSQDTGIADFESLSDEAKEAEDTEEEKKETEETSTDKKTFALVSHYPEMVLTKDYIVLEGTYDSSALSEIYINDKTAALDTEKGKWKKNFQLAKEGANTITFSGKMTDGTRKTLSTVTLYRDNTTPDSPKITSPTTEKTLTTSEKTLTLSGTTSKDATKVVVNGYTLQKYSPGSGTWLYYVSVENGNLKEGANTFSVYSIDKAGNKSDTTTLTITYTPSAQDKVKEEEKKEESTSKTETSKTEETTTTTSTTDTPSVSVPLTAPVITGPSGAGLTVSEAAVVISGSVSPATTKVMVNGYTLQKYTPGATSFSYNAAVRFGTLKEGTNTYSVVAVDKDGNKSPAASITITYQP